MCMGSRYRTRLEMRDEVADGGRRDVEGKTCRSGGEVCGTCTKNPLVSSLAYIRANLEVDHHGSKRFEDIAGFILFRKVKGR